MGAVDSKGAKMKGVKLISGGLKEPNLREADLEGPNTQTAAIVFSNVHFRDCFS